MRNFPSEPIGASRPESSPKVETVVRFRGSQLDAFVKSELSDRLRLPFAARMLGVSIGELSQALDAWDEDDSQLLRLPPAEAANVRVLQERIAKDFPRLFDFGLASDPAFVPLPLRMEEEPPPPPKPEPEKPKAAVRKRAPAKPKVTPMSAPFVDRVPFPSNPPPPASIPRPIEPPKPRLTPDPVVERPVVPSPLPPKPVEVPLKPEIPGLRYRLVLRGFSVGTLERAEEIHRKAVVEGGQKFYRDPAHYAQLRKEEYLREKVRSVLRSFFKDAIEWKGDAVESYNEFSGRVTDAVSKYDTDALARRLASQGRGGMPVVIDLPKPDDFRFYNQQFKSGFPTLLERDGLVGQLEVKDARKPKSQGLHGAHWIYTTESAIHPAQEEKEAAKGLDVFEGPTFQSVAQGLIETKGDTYKTHKGSLNANKPERKQYRRGHKGGRDSKMMM